MSSEFTKWLRDLWEASLQATSNVNYVNEPFSLYPFSQYSKIFVETGTCKGDGVQRALDAGFELIFTVELDLALHQYSLDKFYHNRKVRMFLGKSVDRLPHMLNEIDDPAVFFLDAHPAGPGTAGHEEWLKKDESVYQDTILKQELEIILSHRDDHLIFIDDQHGEDKWNEVYRNMMLECNPDYKFKFFDQVLNGIYHREKILGCLP